MILGILLKILISRSPVTVMMCLAAINTMPDNSYLNKKDSVTYQLNWR